MTHLFSEPQPAARRLIDLQRFGWPPLTPTPDGGLELAATCTIAELSRHARQSPSAAAGLVEQCCRAFLASWKIWNAATVGGNLCNGLPAEVRAAYRERLLGPLAGHEALLATLAAFLRHDASWTRTAEALHVHVNTVHYRIRRIEELTGRDLLRLDARLDLSAALCCVGA